MSTSVINSYACSPANAYGSYAGAFRTDTVYSKTSDIVIETIEGDRVTLSSSGHAAENEDGYTAGRIDRAADIFFRGLNSS